VLQGCFPLYTVPTVNGIGGEEEAAGVAARLK